RTSRSNSSTCTATSPAELFRSGSEGVFAAAVGVLARAQFDGGQQRRGRGDAAQGQRDGTAYSQPAHVGPDAGIGEGAIDHQRRAQRKQAAVLGPWAQLQV